MNVVSLSDLRTGIFTSTYPGKYSCYSILLMMYRLQSHSAAGQPRRAPLIRIGSTEIYRQRQF